MNTLVVDGGVARNDFILQLISNLTGDILTWFVFGQDRDRQKRKEMGRPRVGDSEKRGVHEAEKKRERNMYILYVQEVVTQTKTLNRTISN